MGSDQYRDLRAQVERRFIYDQRQFTRYLDGVPTLYGYKIFYIKRRIERYLKAFLSGYSVARQGLNLTLQRSREMLLTRALGPSERQSAKKKSLQGPQKFSKAQPPMRPEFVAPRDKRGPCSLPMPWVQKLPKKSSSPTRPWRTGPSCSTASSTTPPRPCAPQARAPAGPPKPRPTMRQPIRLNELLPPIRPTSSLPGLRPPFAAADLGGKVVFQFHMS